MAAIENSLQGTKLLLEHGANANIQDKHGRTALSDAITYQHDKIAKLLVKHGANPLLKDRSGKTPLDTAKEKTHNERMIKFLQDAISKQQDKS